MSNLKDTSNSNTADPIKEKVIIIGGGPAGLTAAIYCSRANLNPLVAQGSIKGNLMPGGQLMTTTEVENYPGFPDSISGPDLIERMEQQAKNFGTRFVEEWVSECNFNNSPYTMRIGDKYYQSDAVIIATGATAKWLGLPNENIYRNRGISACATCDGALPMFRNKHIYVVGGGDTAMEEATFLTKFASKVTIIHRRDTLRASKIMQEKALNNNKINFLWNTIVIGYKGTEDNLLDEIIVQNTKTLDISALKCNGLFMGIGHNPETNFLGKTSGVVVDPKGYVKTKDNIYTNIPGVFCCGDVHDTHYKQAITAAGFGCMAAIAVERHLEK